MEQRGWEEVDDEAPAAAAVGPATDSSSVGDGSFDGSISTIRGPLGFPEGRVGLLERPLRTNEEVDCLVACDEVGALLLLLLLLETPHEESSSGVSGVGGDGGEGSTSCVFIVLFHLGWPIDGISDGAGGSYSAFPGFFIGTDLLMPSRQQPSRLTSMHKVAAGSADFDGAASSGGAARANASRGQAESGL